MVKTCGFCSPGLGVEKDSLVGGGGGEEVSGSFWGAAEAEGEAEAGAEAQCFQELLYCCFSGGAACWLFWVALA